MGLVGYTHHYARVRMGQDGHDTDLDIMLAELRAAQAFLEDAEVGLEVLGVDNEKIDKWIFECKCLLDENICVLDRLIDNLLALPRIDDGNGYTVCIADGEQVRFIPGYDDANKAIAEAIMHEDAWVQEKEANDVIWRSGGTIPTYKKGA